MPLDDVGVLFHLKADARQAKQEIAGLRGTITKEIGGITSGLASSAAGNLGIFGSVANSLSSALIGISKSAGPAGDATKKVGEESGKSAEAVTGLASDISTTSTTIKQFAGTAGLAIGGLAAFAGIAVGLASALFGLAKQAADAGARINDLSIKTGLSTETLSGLDNQAKQSGTSLESLSASIFVLQKNMNAAATGNKDLARSFKDLGVDVKGTTDDALRQLFKSLNAIPDVGQRNAAGAKVMGRAYQELSVLFEDVGGDMDKVIDRAKELGLVISGDAAKAADRFNDSLDQLKLQLSAVGIQIGQGLVPEITNAIESIGGSLEGNVTRWAWWGQEVGTIIREVAEMARIVGNILSGDIAGAGVAIVEPMMRGAVRDFDKANPWIDIPLPRAGGRISTGGGGGGGGGKKGGGGAKKEPESNQLEITRQETERFYKEQEEIVQRSYDRQLRTIEEFTDEQVALEQKRSTALRALLIEEMAGIKEKGEARRNKERTINEEIAALEQQTQRTIIQIRDKGAEEAEKIEASRREKFEQARQAADDLRISRIQNAIKERQLLESEGEREITDIRAGAVDRRVELLEMELSKFRTGSSEYLKIQGDIAAAESERVQIIEDGVQRAIDARRREVEDMLSNADAQREARLRDEREDPTSGRSLFGEDFANAIEGGASQWVAFGQTVTGVLNELGSGMANVRDLAGGLFADLAQGLKATATNYILLGSTGPAALKKLAASAIASLAAEAGIRAIFELAKGFASLFFNPAEAAAHFKAAALFGSIAIGAGAIGRSLAGDSFKNTSAGGGSSGGTGGTGTRQQLGSEQERRTIIQPRNQPQQVVVRLDVPHGFVAEKIKENVFLNGELVQLIVETAAR